MHMQMRESVRSGRRENFYVTDNSFIDHYAREMQPVDIAVYHALERYANYHTRSTWVGTAKIAEVLNVSQRTVQRSLKALEDLKLIRIVQTSTMKVYFIVPVPPRTKSIATPLFDGVDDQELSLNSDMGVAWTTSASHLTTSMSRMASGQARAATTTSRSHDTDDAAYKEEQDLLNKTIEQDFVNSIREKKISDTETSAQRIMDILKLPNSLMAAAIAAVEERKTHTRLSMDGIVQEIVTAANQAERRGIERNEFLQNFLVQKLSESMVKELGLPATNSLISTVAASVKAEVTYARSSVEKVAALITDAALEDRRRGIAIDRFYFEGVKWRSNAKISKAEQRKLDNLEVNARVKQRLRERLGAP